MLLEKITEDELEMFNCYREYYAVDENASLNNSVFAPAKEILLPWENAKLSFLYKLFGSDKLILKKEVSYEKSSDQLESEITRNVFRRQGEKFYNNLYNFINNNWYGENNIKKLVNLLYENALAKNKYEGESFEVKFPNGKGYRISTGCKISKALSKIADGFGIEGYEEFRIAHSQVLNQKKLTGNLVLSIHPLDYITMSDNDCGWESCMSWKYNGEYRQGTVEMMNSPSVLVAYLESEKPMKICQKDWSNKKWRQLFIADESLIVSIKDYPYYNRDLTVIVCEWLRELAKENLGLEYSSINKFKNNEESFAVNGRDIIFRFNTDWMYNDFGCVPDYHALMIGNIPEEKIVCNRWYNCDAYEFLYSGPSQCMICGKIHPYLENESNLVCTECQSFSRCDWCEEYCSEENLIYFNGSYICPSCYEYEVKSCDICGREQHIDNLYHVYVIPKMSKEEQEKTYQEHYSFSYYSPKYDSDHTYSYHRHIVNYYFCEDEPIEDFKETFLKENGKVYVNDEHYHSNNLYVYFEDLKNEIIKQDFSAYPTNEVYKNYLKQSSYGFHDLGKLKEKLT